MKCEIYFSGYTFRIALSFPPPLYPSNLSPKPTVFNINSQNVNTQPKLNTLGSYFSTQCHFFLSQDVCPLINPAYHLERIPSSLQRRTHVELNSLFQLRKWSCKFGKSNSQPASLQFIAPEKKELHRQRTQEICRVLLKSLS